jgi:hypothetical protein
MFSGKSLSWKFTALGLLPFIYRRIKKVDYLIIYIAQ